MRVVLKRRSTPWAPLLLPVALSASPFSHPASAVVVRDPAIDSLLRAAVGDAVPGAVAAFVTPDTIWVGAAGVRRVGDTAHVQIGDKFHIGSNTKAFTALLAGVGVERGAIHGNTRPADVLPELRDSIRSSLRGVTLTQLLRMRGGITPFTDGKEFSQLPAEISVGSPREQRRKFAAYALRNGAATPVGKYVYSNASYMIAGSMLERALGGSWESLMRRDIAAPLGIDITFGYPVLNDPNQPWGHYIRNGHLVPDDPRDTTNAVPLMARPAGDIALSIKDFGTFLQANLRGLLGRDGIVRSSTMRMLHDAEGNYAMGWNHFPAGAPGRGCLDVFGDSVSLSMHAGTAGAFFSQSIIVPSKRFALAVIVNSGAPGIARPFNTVCRGLARRGLDAR